MKHASRGVYFLALFVILNIGLASFVLAQDSPRKTTPTPTPSKSATESVEKMESVSGFVYGGDEPIAGARVRVQATDNLTFSGADGSFTLSDMDAGETITVTAWATGFYNGWTQAMAGDESLVITLTNYHQTDNHLYDWFEHEGKKGAVACGSCHPSYKEWQADGHSNAATNYRFLTMYAGTDVHGNQSPAPQKNSLGIPLPLDPTDDPDDPYHGPGFKLDFPNNPGKCATCHTPMAAKMPNAQTCGWSGCHKETTVNFAGLILDPGVSPLDLYGSAAEGISCDFCHKIGQVYLDKETGLPYSDRPGILSYKFHRPPEGKDIFFGSLDDVSEPKDTYLPLFEESEYCAGCHYGIMGDVVVGDMQTKGGVLVYSSFPEWLDSPYSDEETGQTCQDCHMRPDGDKTFFVWPSEGGVIRDPSQIHNHTMMPEGILQESVTLTATAIITDGQVLVDVEVFNDKTGHHMPTDSPLRHAMLVVEAKDSAGKTLRLESGPQLPEWTGNYADQPGRAYAKVLRDKWTGEMPTGAIWRPVEIAEDTRIPALESDVSRYAFSAPKDGVANIEVQLIYRRAYQQLMDWKDWDDPDILMEETTFQIEDPLHE